MSAPERPEINEGTLPIFLPRRIAKAVDAGMLDALLRAAAAYRREKEAPHANECQKAWLEQAQALEEALALLDAAMETTP